MTMLPDCIIVSVLSISYVFAMKGFSRRGFSFIILCEHNTIKDNNKTVSGKKFWVKKTIPRRLFGVQTKDFRSWYFNKMVLQNTLRSNVSAILKSIHVREIVRKFVWVKQC